MVSLPIFDWFFNDMDGRAYRRQLAGYILELGILISTTYMTWIGLKTITCCENPLTAVLSGSMQPTFNRGDLLFLTNYESEPIRVGNIVVYKLESRGISIVHRVIKVHEKPDGAIKFLTKGDNNDYHDRELYDVGQLWLTKSNVVGHVKGVVPYLGIPTILINDYPTVKYSVFALCGISSILMLFN